MPQPDGRRQHRADVAAACKAAQRRRLIQRHVKLVGQQRLCHQQRLPRADGDRLGGQDRIIAAVAVGEGAGRELGLVGRDVVVGEAAVEKKSNGRMVPVVGVPSPSENSGVSSVNVPPPPKPCAVMESRSNVMRALIWSGLTGKMILSGPKGSEITEPSRRPVPPRL